MIKKAIILAGGSGTRFKSEIPKQYFKIGNKSIINYTNLQDKIFSNNINSIRLIPRF